MNDCRSIVETVKQFSMKIHAISAWFVSKYKLNTEKITAGRRAKHKPVIKK